MDILENEVTNGNFPLKETNQIKICLSGPQLNALCNVLNNEIISLMKRKMYLEKNGKPFDFITKKELVIKDLLYEVDSQRRVLNSQRDEYIKQTLDKGVYNNGR